MNRRITTSALALALTVCMANASHAAGFAGAPTGNASNAPVKTKLISFDLRNDASTPLTVQFGDQQMTIAPGKTAAMKVPAGMRVVAVNGVGQTPAGSVITTADKSLSGNTLSVS